MKSFFLFSLQLALNLHSWTFLNHISVWGSIIFYFIFYLIYYSSFVLKLTPQNSYHGVQYATYGGGSFWLCALITPAVGILPVFVYRTMSLELMPTISDRVRLLWKSGQLEEPAKLLRIKPRSSTRMSLKRGGYAFAQEEKLSRRIHANHSKRSTFRESIKGNK